MKALGACRLAARRKGRHAISSVVASLFVLAVLGLVGALVGSATGSVHPATAIGGLTTFTDPTGDAQGAPDVKSITINGDPATGAMTVAVTVTGILPASEDGLTRNVSVFLDTDKNESTGSPSGCEYALEAGSDPDEVWWDVFRWDGSKWQSIPQSQTMTFSRSGDVLTWTLNKTDLDGATRFEVYITTARRDASGNILGTDSAPDGRVDHWFYDLTASDTAPPTPAPTIVLTLQIQAPSTTPLKAVAGKAFTVRFPVRFVSGTSGDPIRVTFAPKSGDMVCAPTVKGKLIAHKESFKSGVARLSFVIPRTASGKLLKVKVAITADDPTSAGSKSATRIATFRVK
jgi:hypothetical protein